MRLAAEAECDPRTARRWLLGHRTHGWALEARLEAAAERLRLEKRAA